MSYAEVAMVLADFVGERNAFGSNARALSSAPKEPWEYFRHALGSPPIVGAV